MNPDHCKDVSLRNVDFPLTAQDIARNMEGRSAYTRTDFIILKHGGEVAVLGVVKEKGRTFSGRYQVSRSFRFRTTRCSSVTRRSTF